MSAEKKKQRTPSFKEICLSCLSGPNLIRSFVILVCLGVVIQQIASCVIKLIDTPITTYTHFDFNKTILYPSVTFCREPPYKYEKMLDYGLYGHPRYTSMWSNYNFSTPLDQLWNDITYDSSEFFAQYGLDGSMDNVELTSTMGFLNGRCYTLTPKTSSSRATRETGFSITLQHSADDVATSISVYPPGYHIFIHYHREPYTEVAVYNGGLVEYLYSNVGETIDVKLSVNNYNMISSDEDPCNAHKMESANECTTQYVWDQVADIAECSGPWMNVSDYPPCSNYSAMRTLISTYMTLHEDHNCTTCPRFCQSYLYKGFVNDRHTFAWDSSSNQWTTRSNEAALQTQIYLYFNTMMVSVYEERYNYDWNLFVSDLGGSVGFLLGLSVLSIMAMLGKIWSTLLKAGNKTPKTQDTEGDNGVNNKVEVNPGDKETRVGKEGQGCLTCNKSVKLKMGLTN